MDEVKAIPLEFIKHYIDELNKIAKDAEKEHPRFAVSCSLKAFHLESLIEAWEDHQSKRKL